MGEPREAELTYREQYLGIVWHVFFTAACAYRESSVVERTLAFILRQCQTGTAPYEPACHGAPNPVRVTAQAPLLGQLRGGHAETLQCKGVHAGEQGRAGMRSY